MELQGLAGLRKAHRGPGILALSLLPNHCDFGQILSPLRPVSWCLWNKKLGQMLAKILREETDRREANQSEKHISWALPNLDLSPGYSPTQILLLKTNFSAANILSLGHRAKISPRPLQLVLFLNWTRLFLWEEGHVPPHTPFATVRVLLRLYFYLGQEITGPIVLGYIASLSLPPWGNSGGKSSRPFQGAGFGRLLTTLRGRGEHVHSHWFHWAGEERRELLFLLYSTRCTGLDIELTWVQVSVMLLSNYWTLCQFPAFLHLSFESADWDYSAYLEELLRRVTQTTPVKHTAEGLSSTEYLANVSNC